MDKINILWTTGDKITALNMLAIYVLNAKKRGWWKEICAAQVRMDKRYKRKGRHKRTYDTLFISKTLTEYVK
jgi:hypothetical protein